MNPVVLHPVTRQLLTFGGEVLEVFSGLESWRTHLGLIKRIQLVSDRKGNHQLVIESTSGITRSLTVDQQAYARVNEAIAEVQMAMASYRLE